MKRLIINADDFGFTPGVNAGIVRAFQEGILTSTTIMANGEAFDDAVTLALANPGLGVGCHLAVVGGRPVAPTREVASLVDENGFMPATLTQLMMKMARGAVQTTDIEREFRAQIERVVKAGIKPSHLDTHKHTHMHPRVMKALARVAVEYGITSIRNPFENIQGPRPTGDAARAQRRAYFKQYIISLAVKGQAWRFNRVVRSNQLRTPDNFFGVALTGLLDSSAVHQIIGSVKEGTTELMCHPGICDRALEQATTRLKHERERELEALTEPALRRFALEQGIELISYKEFEYHHVGN